MRRTGGGTPSTERTSNAIPWRWNGWWAGDALRISRTTSDPSGTVSGVMEGQVWPLISQPADGLPVNV